MVQELWPWLQALAERTTVRPMRMLQQVEVLLQRERKEEQLVATETC